jgi:5-methylcytosine-specific restriction endonuclease McrA
MKVPTSDHKIPKSRGGHGENNIIWACAACNGDKGDLTETEFKHWIAMGRPNKLEYRKSIGLGSPPTRKKKNPPNP